MIIDKKLISIRPASEKDRALIKNIFNMYQNELSVYSDDFLYLDENGYFAPDTADEILPFGDGVFPHIITHNGKNIGFIMATDKRYAPDGADYSLEEIFLVRPFRGTGAAQAAVHMLMASRPGKWSLEVYGENGRALSFWRKLTQEKGSVLETAVPGGLIRMTFTVAE